MEIPVVTSPTRRFGLGWLDSRAGLLTALGLFATDIGYGYIAFAPLGQEYASAGIIAAFIASIMGSLIPALVGGSGPLFGSPRPAQTLIFATLLYSLLSNGSHEIQILLAGAACVSLAGILQIAFGYLGIGKIIRFTPLPVLSGFTNGVALSMMLSALLMITHDLAAPLSQAFDPADLLARVALVLVLLIIMTRLYRLHPALHWSLVGLLAGVLAHALLRGLDSDLDLGDMLPEVTSLTMASGLTALSLQEVLAMTGSLDGSSILAPAISLAVLNTLESLVLASQQDIQHGGRHDSKRLLIGQGLGNMVSGLCCGLPSAPSNSRQMVALQTGATSRWASGAFALAMVALAALTPFFAHYIPQIAVASVLLLMAYKVIDPWTRDQVRAWWKKEGSPDFLRQVRSNLAIMIVVMAVAIAVNLVAALAAGVVLSMLQFVRHNSRSNVARVYLGDKRHSAVMRPLAHTQLLRQHGHRIAMVELSGPLFFGSGELMLEEVEQLAHSAGQIILDFRQVSSIDASGAGVVFRLARTLSRRQVRLRLSSISAHEARGRIILESCRSQPVPLNDWFPDSDLALEAAEDDIIIQATQLNVTHDPRRILELEGFNGLDEAEIHILLGHMREHVHVRGDVLFRRNQPGDCLFILLSGRVEIRVPMPGAGNFKRLVALRPGVIFGEMAILRGAPRSADAVATEDATEVLSLSASELETLSRRHPKIALTLMRNIGAQLASRLASVTDELRHILSSGKIGHDG